MPPNQRPHFFRRKFVSGTQLKSLAVYLAVYRTEIAPASAEEQTAQEEAVSLAKMD